MSSSRPPAHALPLVGLGTSQNDDPDRCAGTVARALELGYRHLDTAQLYGNESAVGAGLARADVPRDEVVVATKIHEDRNAYEAVLESAEASRDRLGVDAIDLLYVHFPVGDYDPTETLPALDELRDAGVVRAVGVSNFGVDQVETAIDVLDVPLAANQIEMHPLLPPDAAHLASARRHGYQLVAYAPFCRGRAFGHEPIEAVAAKHGVSEARVILAWLLGHDAVVTIPKATGEAHLRDNLAAVDLDLDDEDVERIASIEERYRLFDRDGMAWDW